ncbi:hypothetical protein [Haloferula sargassicola]|uniref:Uncharacterized protein n=1 Tax=Haloferula sargassicola TaxID=490096 RepID=A0ABP9UST4_9BACT
MRDRSLTSLEPHYFVVVNADPLGDQLLLLTVASSQVEKVKRRRSREPASTVVEIGEAEYADFTKDSVIDCNQVFTKSLADLCSQWGRKEIVAKLDLPASLLDKLRLGIRDSRLVSEADKRKICGGETTDTKP